MKEMTKEVKIDTIFQGGKWCTQWSSSYTWGEVKALLAEDKIELQDDDILGIGYEEGWDHEGSSCESYYRISLQRPREETDAEFEKRKADREYILQLGVKKRQELYEELKKEFEG